MRLRARRHGGRHAARAASAVPDAATRSVSNRTAVRPSPSAYGSRSAVPGHPVNPRLEALRTLANAAMGQGLRVEVRPEALRLSVVGAEPLSVWADYTRGDWSYMWLRPEDGTTGRPEMIGRVWDLWSVLRTITYTLHEGAR